MTPLIDEDDRSKLDSSHTHALTQKSLPDVVVVERHQNPNVLIGTNSDAQGTLRLRGAQNMSKVPCCARPCCAASKTGYEAASKPSPSALCCGCYCCADGMQACCSRIQCCPPPLRDEGVQAVPQAKEQGTMFRYAPPTQTAETQTWKVGGIDMGTSMTHLEGAVVRNTCDQTLARIEQVRDGRVLVSRVIAKHDLRTGFQIETEDMYAGGITQETLQWDHIHDRSRNEAGKAAHEVMEALQESLRAAVVPRASEASGASGDSKRGQYVGSLGGVWSDRTPTSTRRNIPLLSHDGAAGSLEQRPVKVLTTIVSPKEGGDAVVTTLKVLTDLISEDSWAMVRRQSFEAAAARSAAYTSQRVAAARRSRSLASLPTDKDAKAVPEFADQLPTVPEATAESARELRPRSDKPPPGVMPGGPSVSTPWEARLAKMFVLEEYDVGTRRIRTTDMSFDMLLSKVKHPLLVRTAVKFLQEIGLRKASPGWSGTWNDPVAVEAEPGTSLAMLGHGKFSDWIPLATMRTMLGKRKVIIHLNMRYRRTMFSPERAVEIRSLVSRGTDVPLNPNVYTSTHALTRFLLDVTDEESGAIVMRQQSTYAELIANQKIAIADLADDIIASMEIAENKLHLRQLEYLEQLQRSAVAEHEDGIRHVIPPSVVASRDEAARRIQEAVRRWRVRKREQSVMELVDLIQTSVVAHQELKSGMDSMHCTSIRQWLTGVSPFSASTHIMRTIAAKRRAMGARGRVVIDPLSGKRKVRHPTLPRQPRDLTVSEPPDLVVEDVLALLEEQSTLQAVDGEALSSNMTLVDRQRQDRSKSVRAFLRSARAAELGAVSQQSLSRSSSFVGRLSMQRKPSLHRSMSVSSISRRPSRANSEIMQVEPMSGFIPLTPTNPTSQAREISRRSKLPNHEAGTAKRVARKDGSLSGAHGGRIRAQESGAVAVEAFHGASAASPRDSRAASAPSSRRGLFVKDTIGDLSVAPRTHAYSVLHARAGLLKDEELEDLIIPEGAEGMENLPSASAAHFVPGKIEQLALWVEFLDNDDSYGALLSQWKFASENRRPDTPPEGTIGGNTIYDAEPTLVPLPDFATGMHESQYLAAFHALPAEERERLSRLRAQRAALNGLALTIDATPEQAELAAREMLTIKRQLEDAILREGPGLSPALHMAAKAESESMRNVVMYNDAMKDVIKGEVGAVVPGAMGGKPSLTASRQSVAKAPKYGAYGAANRERLVKTAAVASRVRETKEVLQQMQRTGQLSITQRSGTDARPASPDRYSSTPFGTKARHKTSLAHAAGTLLYPAEKVDRLRAPPAQVGGVAVNGVDAEGFSGEWADGITRRNAGGRWISPVKMRERADAE
jgi:hypothetical protein